MPQNEESVAACGPEPTTVLGATNDYRGDLDPAGNFTGWHLSIDGGRTVTQEGLLPAVAVGSTVVPSGGDPVAVALDDCTFYAGSLAYDPRDDDPNGIAVYRGDRATLLRCPGGSAPGCWPVRRMVAVAEPNHFLDKEWIDAGPSGDAGTVVWAVYTDFESDDAGSFVGASVYAVRCDAALSACTDPIRISGADADVQFADVTVGPDGRTYVSWSEIRGEIEGEPQTFVHKLRIAPAGSTSFGPVREVYEETLPIPFGGALHANAFRITTILKHEVALVKDKPRIFVTWEACTERPFDFVCVEPVIKLLYSDDDGATWSAPTVLSTGGDNYFPTLAADGAGNLAVAWFTSRFDPQFHNLQDVELVVVNVTNLRTTNRRRVTDVSNEPEADTALGPGFIGDYIEVTTHNGAAYIHYNANYRQLPLLGEGVALPQQDNFLARVPIKDHHLNLPLVFR